MADYKSELDAAQRLRVGYLLALVGGYMDAYSYVLRDGVFASAQSGNIIKLGIALSHGESESYLTFLLPMMAFALGVFFEKLIEDFLIRRNMRLMRRGVLAVEAIALAIVGFIPLGGLNMLANCIASFVSAMQYEAFAKFRGESIGTTMTTGNFRQFCSALYESAVHHEETELKTAAIFLGVVGMFVGGAFLGALGSGAMGAAAVAPVIACLVVIIVIITILRKRNAA